MFFIQKRNCIFAKLFGGAERYAHFEYSFLPNRRKDIPITHIKIERN